MISSLGAPLIPTIAADLHASLGATQWTLTATLLVGAVASPVIGRCGDGRFRKEVILGCLASVVTGGVLASLATSLPLLIVGRAMQGMGLALIPLTMAEARAHLSPAGASRAIAMLSVTAAAGVGIGYPLTGLIADGFGVRGAFWFSVLASAVALGAAALVLRGSRHETGAGSLDVVGALLLGTGLVGLLLALGDGATWGWGSAETLGLLAGAAILIAVWVRHELRTSDPLVDLRLVRHPAVITANGTGMALGLAMYLTITIVTQFVQLPRSGGIGFGATVFGAGLTQLPLSVFSLFVTWRVPVLQRRVGIRPLIPVGALTIALAALVFGLTADRLWQAYLTMGLIGIGLGLTFTAMPALIVAAVPPGETGSALGFYQVSRYVGYSAGSGLSVTLLRVFGHGAAPTLSTYRWTMLVAALLCALTAVVSWLFPGPRRAPDRVGLAELEVEEGRLGSAGLPAEAGRFESGSIGERPSR